MSGKGENIEKPDEYFITNTYNSSMGMPRNIHGSINNHSASNDNHAKVHHGHFEGKISCFFSLFSPSLFHDMIHFILLYFNTFFLILLEYDIDCLRVGTDIIGQYEPSRKLENLNMGLTHISSMLYPIQFITLYYSVTLFSYVIFIFQD